MNIMAKHVDMSCAGMCPANLLYYLIFFMEFHAALNSVYPDQLASPGTK